MSTITVPLTCGKFAVIDEADADLVLRYKWQAIRRYRSDSWYAFRTVMINGRKSKQGMHRLIADAKPNERIDHRDRNGLNNTRANLRRCTPRQNSCNRAPCRGESRYAGVSRAKLAPFKAYIDRKHLGYYEDETTAALVRDCIARQRHGEFAFLNFSDVTVYPKTADEIMDRSDTAWRRQAVWVIEGNTAYDSSRAKNGRVLPSDVPVASPVVEVTPKP